METTARIIEWIFSSPLIWIAILGIVSVHSLRIHALRMSAPYAPLIEEKTENIMGRRTLLSLLIGAVAAFLIYITQSAISFSYVLGIWFIAFIFIANSKVSLAFLFSAFIIGLIALIFKDYEVVLKVVRYSSLYQAALGLMYLIGKKKTYPIVQMQKDGSIAAEHMFKEAWLLPAVAFSFGDNTFSVFSYLLLAMLLVCEIRIRLISPKKHFKKYGLFMLVTGLIIFGLSFVVNYYIALLILFLLLPSIIITFIIVEQIAARKSHNIFVANDKGVQVLYVYDNTPASDMSVEIGDIITSVNGKRVVRIEAISNILEDKPPFIWLEIDRDGALIETEYKDYKKGVSDLGIIHTPFKPSKFDLYPRPGFFARQAKRLKAMMGRGMSEK